MLPHAHVTGSKLPAQLRSRNSRFCCIEPGGTPLPFHPRARKIKCSCGVWRFCTVLASVSSTPHLSGLIGMAKSLQHPAHDPATAAMYKRLPGRRRHATHARDGATAAESALAESRLCSQHRRVLFSLHHFFRTWLPSLPSLPNLTAFMFVPWLASLLKVFF